VIVKVIKQELMRKETVKEMMYEKPNAKHQRLKINDQLLIRTVRCLRLCSSPFIVRLFGAVVLSEPCLMVLEPASLIFSTYLETRGNLTELTKLDFCYQAALAVAYLHSLDFVVATRNFYIATRNFFYCSGKLKFGDFSIARRLKPDIQPLSTSDVSSVQIEKSGRSPTKSETKSV
ncbi:hypothetical protein PFISCL1PPCAC_18038, partial [Pristionchus fissidentatus]